MIMIFTFWTLIFLTFYCYFGYPLLLIILTKLKTKETSKADIKPTVSIIISVCDEEDVIINKLKNLYEIDYPKDKIEILIGSDGSTDNTNSLISNFVKSRNQDKENYIKVLLFDNKNRRGKTSTINDLVKKASNDIIVFTDARQKFDKKAVSNLMMNFADQQIGCVSGELIFEKEEGSTAKGVSLYWTYEKSLRKMESQIHSMLGATGAIYSIKKELFTPCPYNIVLDDMYIPLKIIEKGYRATFDDTAKAYDKAASNPKEEYTRKARTLYGNYQLFYKLPQMFNPLKSPIAIQLFSHKFLRVIIPFFLIIIFLINILLREFFLYNVILKMQLLFYLLAFIGVLARKQKYGILKVISRICYIPYTFCLLNFSAFVGFIRFLNAKQKITWRKARRQ